MQEYIEAHSRLEAMTGEVVALVGFDYRHHEVIADRHGVRRVKTMVIRDGDRTGEGKL